MGGDKLTIADVRHAVEKLKSLAVPPGVVKTKRQAKAMNRTDALLGLKNNWKVGDEYYEMRAHPVVFGGG